MLLEGFCYKKIAELLEDAAECLVIARIARQEAQVSCDLANSWEGYHLNVLQAEERREAARLHRVFARSALRLVEQYNGRLFLAGRETVPLRRSFNGSRFKEWKVYKTLYSENALFRGVDPD